MATLKKQIEQNPEDGDQRFTLAAVKLMQDDYEGALSQLLEIEKDLPDYRNGRARKGMLAIFVMLGGSHKLVEKYRRQQADQH